MSYNYTLIGILMYAMIRLTSHSLRNYVMYNGLLVLIDSPPIVLIQLLIRAVDYTSFLARKEGSNPKGTFWITSLENISKFNNAMRWVSY